MPELIEVEYYRSAMVPLVGSRVERVEVIDAQFVRPRGRAVDDFEQLVGSVIVDVRRHGKLMMVDLTQGESEIVLGMRFGMTGRLLVDGEGPIERLEYASNRDEDAWDRFRMHVDDHAVAIRDPRRLGSVELEPDDGALGPDAATIDAEALGHALVGRTASIKATLLNQNRIAGLGNLLVDEILWRSGMAPQREAGSLSLAEIDYLASAIEDSVADLMDRGGSHTGDTFPERRPEGHCPLDGSPMRRDVVGGRSTWWCAQHQR